MTFEETEAVLKTITYKPGWFLQVRHPKEDVVQTFFAFETQSSNDEGLRLPIHSSEELWLDALDEENFIHRVYEQILRTEEHEAKEWFRVKGVRLHDPHPALTYAKEHPFEPTMPSAGEGGSGYLQMLVPRWIKPKKKKVNA